jgi:hypothetical protein
VVALLSSACLVACSADDDEPGPSGGTGGTSSGTGGAGAQAGTGGTSTGGTGGCAEPTDFQGRNNSALIDGDSFPGGGTAHSQLVKTVPATISTPQPDFQVGSATISRVTPSGEMALYVMIPVTNVGCRAYCFLSLDAEYLDGDGAVLETPTLDVINGSVGRSGTFYDSACLAPGETGYVTDNVLFTAFDDVASVSGEVRFDSDPVVGTPEARVIPQSYSFDAGTGLAVVVHNEGSAEALVYNAVSFYLLLDDAGEPLWWNDLKTPGEADATMAAGASLTLSDPDVGFGGDGSQALIFVSYAQP